MNIALAAKSKFPPYISHSITVILGAGIATTNTRTAPTKGFALIGITFMINARTAGNTNNFMRVLLHASLSLNNSEALLLARAIPIKNIDNGVVIFESMFTGIEIIAGRLILPK